MTADVHVIPMEQRRAQWDRFVASHPGACVYHDSRWKEIFEGTFGHRCHYLAAERQGEVEGVLPLVEVRTLVFRHVLVSLPCVTYGGIAARSEDAGRALAQAAVRLAQQLGTHHIELRQASLLPLDWPSRTHKVALAVPASDDPHRLWSSLSSRMRGKIRKAQREATFTISGPEAIESFYSVFCRNMRDLGTPVYPLRFFEHIGRSFHQAVRLFLVGWQGRPVAAAFGLEDGSVLRLPWICSDYRCGGIYATEYLYWSVLQWAADHHFASVDLGRSTAESGGHRFKRQFRPQEEMLHWYYWTSNGARAPYLSPDNPRLRWACHLWSHLPLAVANHLGPWVVKNLP